MFSTRPARRVSGVAVAAAAMMFGVTGCDPGPPPWSSLDVVSVDASGPLPGSVFDVDLSADGSTAAFALDFDNASSVDYVADLASGGLVTPAWVDEFGRPVLLGPLRLTGDGSQAVASGSVQVGPTSETRFFVRGDVTGTVVAHSEGENASAPPPSEYVVTPDGSTLAYVGGLFSTRVAALTDLGNATTVATPDPEVGSNFRTPGISADGRYVSFVSEGSDTGNDVRVRDLTTGTLTTVTDGPGDESFAGTITPDGTTVILYGTLDGATGIHAYDMATGTSQVVLPATVFGARDITASADGQRIVLTQGTAWGADRAVWFLDRANGKFVQLSVNADYEPGNGASYAPTVSADGHTVSFISEATNLSPDDADAAPSAYVVTVP